LGERDNKIVEHSEEMCLGNKLLLTALVSIKNYSLTASFGSIDNSTQSICLHIYIYIYIHIGLYILHNITNLVGKIVRTAVNSAWKENLVCHLIHACCRFVGPVLGNAELGKYTLPY
jgi:hypothetical protein